MIMLSFAHRCLLFLIVFQALSQVAHAVAPVAPSSCAAAAISRTATQASITLSWVDNSTNETKWIIQVSANGGAFGNSDPILSGSTGSAGNSISFTWNAASLNTTYRFRIIASNGTESSTVSNTATVGTFDLNNPINFSVTVIDPFNVAMSWEEGSTSESGFSLERKIGDGAWSILGEVSANELSLVPLNLVAPLGSYSFRLRAYTGTTDPTTPDSSSGSTAVSAYSNVVSLTTTAYTLTGSAVPGQTVINLSWPNILNESGYRIYVLLPNVGNYQLLDSVAANVTSYQVTSPDIGAAETYSFIVAPINSGGLMGESNAVTITVDGITSKTGTSGTPGAVFFHEFTQLSGSGSAVVSRSLTGVPTGLSFDAGTGVLSGIYPALGNHALTYFVEFANGGILSQTFHIRVRPAAGPPIVRTVIPAWNGVVGANQETLLAETFSDPEAESAVRVSTTLGDMDFILFDTATPATVQNFMNYVSGEAYTDVAFHRSIAGFVIQGGGFKGTGTSSHFTSVVTSWPVMNEPGIANVRGTVSMAKQGGNPDSATSQFFVSLGDNRANLDYQNGGFTVFGRVAGTGMTVADAISNLPTSNYGVFLDSSVSATTFEGFPMNAVTAPATMDQSKLLKIHSVSVIPTMNYRITGNSQPAVASASIVDGVLRLNGLVAGQTTITVTATDLDDLSTSQDVVVTISDTFSTWTSQNSFPGGRSGILQDADGDTLTNLLEYAYLGNPAVSSQSPLPIAGKTGGGAAAQFLTLTFPVRKFTSDLLYVVEANNQFTGTWTEIWRSTDGFVHAQVASAVDQSGRTVVTIKDTAVIGGKSTRFLRTRVVKQ